MSQLDSLRALDAVIHSAMTAAGVGDSGQYQVGTGTAIPCRCYFDESQQEFGEDAAPVVGRRRLLSIFLEDVPSPQKEATVTIGSDVWRLKSQAAIDQSIAQWVVHG